MILGSRGGLVRWWSPGGEDHSWRIFCVDLFDAALEDEMAVTFAIQNYAKTASENPRGGLGVYYRCLVQSELLADGPGLPSEARRQWLEHLHCWLHCGCYGRPERCRVGHVCDEVPRYRNGIGGHFGWPRATSQQSF